VTHPKASVGQRVVHTATKRRLANEAFSGGAAVRRLRLVPAPRPSPDRQAGAGVPQTMTLSK